jgi:murein tripeptide amidase MpaA
VLASLAEVLARRLGVVLTARVHPGESNASWIMEGIIDYLTSDCEGARDLRKKFVFKVVPMLNPDGVINGNYRTSLAGVDLNRRWDRPDPDLHPTIWNTKEMVRRFLKTRAVILQMDIHGHSRKEGLFTYGCVPDRGWEK